MYVPLSVFLLVLGIAALAVAMKAARSGARPPEWWHIALVLFFAGWSTFALFWPGAIGSGELGLVASIVWGLVGGTLLLHRLKQPRSETA